MKIDEVNEQLRQIFIQLINDSFKKRSICALTLGLQSEPQFERFISGADFGIKPLQRIVEDFNYDIHLIFVEKNDTTTKKNIKQYNEQFLNYLKSVLVKNLSDSNVIKSSSAKGGILAEIASQIYNDIIKE